ncbi:putative disease resistance protein RGA3 [Chenopodium quinoa]|uniref:putative disease resistance protein RGA3 n=1 Tax=Chenopodium quinoa TaxID=63459 RepID=UPI000B786B86|nr:putative disease resistance protein RGA3 [Chenopodium quinoa]
MAEAIILPIAKSILGKIASFTGDLAMSSISEEIKAAKSAKKDINKIADKLTAICAVLEDAEEKQFTNKAMKLWLRELKSVVYDIDDLLDEVAFDALLRKANEGHFRRQLRYYLSSSNPIISRFNLSHKVKDLRETLESVVNKKNEFGLTERPVEFSRDSIRDPFDGCAHVCESDVMGREMDKQDIIRILIDVTDVSELTVLPIVGMGGIGKTTLAKLVYHDVHHFDLKLWVCVSDKFHIPKIMEDILKSGAVGSGDNTSNQQLDDLLIQKLHVLLGGKKYLLVLDDVWVEDIAMWIRLKNVLAVGNPGSVLLITTRNSKVASITQTCESYDLDSLPMDVCWSIFKQLAFKDGEEDIYPNLHEIGWSINKKCRGIPLVVKSLGSLLRNERNEQEWRRVDSMYSFSELEQQYDKVLQLLKLSYVKLPSHLKPCFAHASLFLKDSILHSNVVPYIWSAIGLLPLDNKYKGIEDYGYSYFMELASKSLFEEPSLCIDGIYCQSKIHNLLHDLAVYIMEDELAVVTLDKVTDVSFARHIVWGYNSSDLRDKEFPMKLLNAKKARTFRFVYEMKQHVSMSFLEGIISNFSCLRILEFGSLWFEELPESIGNLKHLRYLDLSYNPFIKSLPSRICDLLNLETLRIHRCEQLKKLPRNMHRLQNLKNFQVTTCQVSLVEINELSSLQHLFFDSCKRLKSFWDNDNTGHLTSLRRLYIENCPKLTSLPNSMKYLVGLQILFLHCCEGLDLNHQREAFEGLQSLRLLYINNVKMTSLPSGIQSAATSLQYLIIVECGSLMELPDCFHGFTSLREVSIGDCPNMWSLPHSFRHLTSLQKLYIVGCPSLSERCAVPDGEDYSLISHCANFELDGVTFTPSHSR